ncbi:type II toxin-antitoxin system RelE/ParE family toxin [Prosthecobacter sp.]|uniref:type II toxin-antitoxin system RelE/ParE family toxin n=1 Tax=Prosthecobacter sp. TaxID=1965333 RepID=UPI0037849CC3
MSSNEIVLLQGAQSDLLSIYAVQGEQTYLRVDQALGILRLFPEAGPMHHKNKIRRLVVTRTHFGVFYSITGTRVLVGAVMDLRQSPRHIVNRLNQL